MVKYCPDCGNSIIDSNMPFCPKCGAKLPLTSPEVQPPAIEPVAVQQPAHPSYYIPPVNSTSTSVQTPAQQPQSSTTESTTKKTSTIEWIAICCGGIILLIVISAFISGMGTYKASQTTSATPATPTVVSSTGGDQAAIAKMSEMTNWMMPTMSVIGDSASSGDYMKLGINAALLRMYIDKNLPEMRQLAEGATTKKAAAQEFVAFLEDLRTSTDLTVQAVDKYNSGDINGSTALLTEGTTYTNKASAHMKRLNALM